jgi:hypothetical protein
MQTYEIRLTQRDWIAEVQIVTAESVASAVARARTLLARHREMEGAQIRSRGGVLLAGVGQSF